MATAEGQQLFLNIVLGTWSGGSGQAVGELSPRREVWSRSTAAAALWPTGRLPANSCLNKFPSREPDLRSEAWAGEGGTGAGTARGTLGYVLSPSQCLRWEEEYTVRIQLQERVTELQEVRGAAPLPLLPGPSPAFSHPDTVSPVSPWL